VGDLPDLDGFDYNNLSPSRLVPISALFTDAPKDQISDADDNGRKQQENKDLKRESEETDKCYQVL